MEVQPPVPRGDFSELEKLADARDVERTIRNRRERNVMLPQSRKTRSTRRQLFLPLSLFFSFRESGPFRKFQKSLPESLLSVNISETLRNTRIPGLVHAVLDPQTRISDLDFLATENHPLVFLFPFIRSAVAVKLRSFCKILKFRELFRTDHPIYIGMREEYRILYSLCNNLCNSVTLQNCYQYKYFSVIIVLLYL